MHQAADDGRGELRPSHSTKVAERRDVDRAELGQGGVNPSIQRVEDRRDVPDREVRAFEPKRRELISGQHFAARVGEEPINDSGDVSHVKRGGCHVCGTSVPLGLRQILDELADTFANLKQNVRDRLQDDGDAIDRTALPPLGIRHRA
jgi:hypothetical protein